MWRGVANFVGCLFREPDLCTVLERYDERKTLGPSPFKESAGNLQWRYCNEVLSFLRDGDPKRMTTAHVYRKLKDMKKQQMLEQHVYCKELPIHDSQRMSQHIHILLLPVEAWYQTRW